MQLFSQLGQDAYVLDRFFRAFTRGTFIDIGAYDGITFSNTYFFERYLGWNGMCFEPLPSAYELLRQNRLSICVPCAVCDYNGVGKFTDVEVEADGKMLSGLTEHYDPRHVDRINEQIVSMNNIEVSVRSMSSILNEQANHTINYLSIDTEGSELRILSDIDYNKFKIDVLSVENNYGDVNIGDLLKANGFELVHVFHGYDELYCRNGFSGY